MKKDKQRTEDEKRTKEKTRAYALRELAKIDKRQTERVLESIVLRLPLVKEMKHINILSGFLDTILDAEECPGKEG